MKIREEQLKAFGPVADKVFSTRVARRIREKHPDATVRLPAGPVTVEQLPDDLLHELILRGFVRARQYGMSDEYSLAAFVVLMVLTAPNFDDHPSLRRTLSDESIRANAKVDLLLESASEENWQEVKESYDPRAWGL